MNKIYSQEKMASILVGAQSFKRNPLLPKTKYLRSNQYEVFTKEEIAAFDLEPLNSRALNQRKGMLAENKDIKRLVPEDILDVLGTDISKVNYDSGMFGKNIEKNDNYKAIIDDPFTKSIYNIVIDEMSKSYREGIKAMLADEVSGEERKMFLPFSYSSSMGFNGKTAEHYAFGNDATSKLQFLDNLDSHLYKDVLSFDKNKPSRGITTGFRLTMQPKDKLRPSFFLNKTGGITEGKTYLNGHSQRIRQVASVSWLDNASLMTVNSAINTGMTPFLKRFIGFTSKTILDQINETGLEMFATDVASADYTHHLKDVMYFSKQFDDGFLERHFNIIYKDLPIYGVANSKPFGKIYYYEQTNYGRFFSGVGLTYFLNVVRYLTIQLSRLYLYHKHVDGLIKNPDILKMNGYTDKLWKDEINTVITKDDLSHIKAFNKGDDAADMIKPGSSNIYEAICTACPYVETEKEIRLSFDGKLYTGEPGKYLNHTQMRSLIINIFENRESRDQNHPLVSYYITTILGMLDHLEQYPTPNPEDGEIVFEKVIEIFGFDLNKILSYRNGYYERISTELNYSNDSRATLIDTAVRMLELKNSSELAWKVDTSDIFKLGEEIANAIFILRPAGDMVRLLNKVYQL